MQISGRSRLGRAHISRCAHDNEGEKHLPRLSILAMLLVSSAIPLARQYPQKFRANRSLGLS